MDDQLIIEYVRMLSVSLRRQKNITASDIEAVRKIYAMDKISECVARIKQLCGLNIPIVIGCLRGCPDQDSLMRVVKKGNDLLGQHRFQPSPLEVKKLCDSVQRGTTAAFLMGHSNIPAFGTRDFETYKVAIFIFDWIKNYPFETFALSITHELSHIVLRAIRHPLEADEIAVDLTAMILGFHDIYRLGRISGNKKLGYLDDHQFQIAYDEIRRREKIIYL